MNKQCGYTVIEMIYGVFILVFLVGVGGWIANIVKLIGSNFDHINGMIVARIVGIPLGPLGAILGFF